MLLFSVNAEATFSIIACDLHSGSCGVAVATNNLAVGSSVGYAKAGVGAIVTQFETNPNYGRDGIKLLSKKISAVNVLNELLGNDNNFEGAGIEERQVAIVNIRGKTSNHNGEKVLNSPYAGSISGKYFSVQGNGLESETVLESMKQAFINTKGGLDVRLLTALEVGQARGGQATGEMSAALLVSTIDGWPIDTDFRVDASKQPIKRLRQLLNLKNARQNIIKADRYLRAGDKISYQKHLNLALILGPDWDRILLRAAKLALAAGESKDALEYLKKFVAVNPKWAEIALDCESFLPLSQNQAFILMKSKTIQKRTKN